LKLNKLKKFNHKYGQTRTGKKSGNPKVIGAKVREVAGQRPVVVRGYIPFFLVFALCAGTAGALDFGLAISQTARTSNESGETAFFYSPVLSPWVQGPVGERFSFYLSGRVGFEYTAEFGEDGGRDSGWRDPVALPELDRTELTWIVSPALYLTLGRQRYRDVSGMAASGLFDGLSANFSAWGSRFSAGAYYTGLLYKDTADIIMTTRDKEEHAKPFSLDGSYFASRRVLAAFEWENPGIGPRSSLTLGLLAQFDLNGEDDWFHSQYLSARYGFRVTGSLGLEGTAALGAGESRGNVPVFFAGALGLSWAVPGSWDDSLGLRGIYSSPSAGSRLVPFVPVSSLPQGQVFTPAIGGVSIIRGAYTLRPHRTLSLTTECSYFIRTDTESFQDNREPDKLKGEGYFLGGELYGAASWTPLPDLSLSVGGGAFFPRLGNAFEPEAEIRWKASLGLILSL
jgi:hypothetical protein